MAVLNASFALAFYVGCPEQLLQLKREIHRIEQSHEVSCLSVRDPQSLKPGSGASSSGRRRDGSAREGDCTEERKSSREPSTQTGRAGPLSFLETKVAAPTKCALRCWGISRLSVARLFLLMPSARPFGVCCETQRRACRDGVPL